MQITINRMSDQSLIEFANTLSRELDITTSTTARPNIIESFEEICTELEYRGVVLSDHVVCPRTL